MEKVKLKNNINRFSFKHGKLHGAELYLLIVLLVFGTAACFFLPISGGYDEEQHLFRVWEMSDYTFLPNQKLRNHMPFPRLYLMLSYRRDSIVRAVPSDFWKNYGSLSLDSKGYVDDIDTRSVYSPPLLLPQALTMRFLGRSHILSALAVYYACRLAGLLSYIFLSLLAVRLIPYGKWTLAILASSPVLILQSGTITPDTISNGIAFLFIGGCLLIATYKEIGRKELAALAILIFVLFWAKINIIPLVLLPFLIIPPSKFKSRNGYIFLLVTTIVLFLVEVAGWNIIGYSRYSDALPGADPVGQIKFILADLPQFSKIIFGDIWFHSLVYLNDWIAIYGLNYWPVPIWTYYLYGAGLFASLFIQEEENIPEYRIRIGLVITFVAAYVWTIVSLYLSYTPTGSSAVFGVQGRYFTGVMPLFFLAVTCLPFLKQIHVPTYIPLFLGGSSLVLYITGMYLSYQVTCGSQYYAGGLCYQPNYKNWDPNALYSAPVSAELSLKQKLAAECDGMTEFRVWMDSSAADPNGVTEFSLINSTTDQTVISLSVSNADLPKKTWYTINFPPDRNSTGNDYAFNIRTSTGGDGPRVAYSIKPDYLRGKLFENDTAIDKDLIFQMGCVAGWNK